VGRTAESFFSPILVGVVRVPDAELYWRLMLVIRENDEQRTAVLSSSGGLLSETALKPGAWLADGCSGGL
jgi:hypothetical protein